MKIIVVANDVNHYSQLNKLGITNIVVSSKYSSYRDEFSIEEIKQCFELNSNLTVSIYDLIKEEYLDAVLAYLDMLLDIGVVNFIVNDIGIVNYLRKFNVNITLDNFTLNTNYETLNIWSSYGVSSAVVGRELTLEEINEIEDNCSIDTIVHVQGVFPIFTSIRSLVSNYFEYIVKQKSDEQLYLYDKSRQSKYPIIEKSNGVVVFSAFEQCCIDLISQLNVNTVLIDQPFIDNENSISVVKLYLEAIENNNHTIDEVSQFSDFTQSRGFFFKKTLYKL